MKRTVLCILVLALLSACDRFVPPPTPEFELRDFVITEETKEATEYSKAWNTFKGAGTLVARNVGPERNLLVFLEILDKTKGTNSEPQYVTVLFRGGVGKVETHKSEYVEMTRRPEYQWSVLGWQELNPATVKVLGSQGR